ncbi:hypothetical protein H6P81_007435 [Aristolochia fimbriata]|uniref:Protein LOW PSII ACCUMULATION 2, chloroplastic n=1 Tax=Aristolochia fimbriata TaxID=158543 RepID=A0AAV7F3W1_ARIFI|nr:hypothetical protein H6P81_007435 [Aristolochia fimbriata]
MAFVIPAPNSLRAGSGSLLRSPRYYRHCFVNRRRTRAQAEGEDTGATRPPDQQASVTVSSPSTKSKGLGFGSSVEDSSSVSTRKDKERGSKKKGSRDRASVVRRTPIDKPPLLSPDKDTQSEKQQSTNEGAFLLTWLGLGILIFVQGIVLAASGFLPEEWDKFFVKYLYPSFTPTVFLFVAGTVGYGVYKYMQGENQRKM